MRHACQPLGPGLETAQGARLTYSRQPRPHPAVSNFARWVGLPRAGGGACVLDYLLMSQYGYSVISHRSCSHGVRVRLPELTALRDVRVVLGDADCGEKVALVARHCA